MQFASVRAAGIKFTSVSKVIALAKLGVGYCVLLRARGRSLICVEHKQCFYCLFDVTLRKTNSWRTLMTAVVPKAMAAFSKVNAAP